MDYKIKLQPYLISVWISYKHNMIDGQNTSPLVIVTALVDKIGLFYICLKLIFIKCYYLVPTKKLVTIFSN